MPVQLQKKKKDLPELPTLFTIALVHIGIIIMFYVKYIGLLITSGSSLGEKRKHYPPLYNRLTDKRIHLINLASFNYLGLSKSNSACASAAIRALHKYGLTSGNTRLRYGTTLLHHKLEKLTADFLGTEDAVAFGMGYATSVMGLPALAGPGTLVVSDEENHASMIVGSRMSGATVRVFKHNDMEHLEKILKEAIYYGQTSNTKYVPWRKILILVEGVYSMEGSVAALPEIVELKKKYKAFLYVDEAHSIGVLGKHGRGVQEHFNLAPNDIDVLMGSYSKAFGSSGGYIAGSKNIINYLRENSAAAKHGWALPPPCVGQVIEAMRFLKTEDGRRAVETLGRNAMYFRKRLREIGLCVRGYERSPVVPVLVYHYSKLGELVRSLFKNNVAVVGVGYPAVKITDCRVRICISTEHTQSQLDYVLEQIRQVADRVGLRYSRRKIDPAPDSYGQIVV